MLMYYEKKQFLSIALLMLRWPVCPGRVNGFSLFFLEKPFTLPGHTGIRQKSIMFHWLSSAF